MLEQDQICNMAMVNDLKKTRLLLNRLFTAQLVNFQVPNPASKEGHLDCKAVKGASRTTETDLTPFSPSQEVPKTADRGASRCIYLWSASYESAAAKLVDESMEAVVCYIGHVHVDKHPSSSFLTLHNCSQTPLQPYLAQSYAAGAP
jgi:hypothetical protein